MQQADQVRDGLAFDAEKVLQARHRIVASLQRASDRCAPLKTRASDRITLVRIFTLAILALVLCSCADFKGFT
jgi:hypothetical protein